MKLKQLVFMKNRRNSFQQSSGITEEKKKADFWELFNLLDLPVEEKVYNASSFAYLNLVEGPKLEDKYYQLSYECLDNTFKKLNKGMK